MRLWYGLELCEDVVLSRPLKPAVFSCRNVGAARGLLPGRRVRFLQMGAAGPGSAAHEKDKGVKQVTVIRADSGRDNKGRFVKGNSNGGRKPMPDAFKKKCIANAEHALDTLIAIMNDRNEDAAKRISAGKIVIEYAYGKPAQDVSNTIKFGEMGDFTLEIKAGDGDED